MTAHDFAILYFLTANRVVNANKNCKCQSPYLTNFVLTYKGQTRVRNEFETARQPKREMKSKLKMLTTPISDVSE